MKNAVRNWQGLKALYFPPIDYHSHPQDNGPVVLRGFPRLSPPVERSLLQSFSGRLMIAGECSRISVQKRCPA